MGLGLLWGTAVMGMDSAAAGMGSCVPLSMQGVWVSDAECPCRVTLPAAGMQPWPGTASPASP